jgi:trehalose-6-phosphate synthase
MTKFTEEEKQVLKRIHEVRAQMQKEMKNMTQKERLDYMNGVGAEFRRGRSKKPSTATI